jgi:hypothetical protein
MPAHSGGGGRDGNYLAGTQIQRLRMSGPLDGVLAGTSCWPSFLSLCTSLDLFWVALNRMASFNLEP